LGKQDRFVREAIITSLRLIGMRGHAVFAKALRSPDMETAIQAARLLGENGNETALEPLVEALKDDRAEVRKECRNALVRLTKRTMDASDESWRSWLEFRKKHGRRRGTLIRPVFPQAVEAVLAALKSDESWQVRVEAPRALGSIDPQGAETIRALEEARRDKDARVVDTAKEVPKAIGKG